MAAQKEADQALLGLIEAYANLENGTVNFGLRAAISGTIAILEDPATAAAYSQESVQAVETALQAAKETAENPEASQDEINFATRTLITAVNSLLEKEDSVCTDCFRSQTEFLRMRTSIQVQVYLLCRRQWIPQKKQQEIRMRRRKS